VAPVYRQYMLCGVWTKLDAVRNIPTSPVPAELLPLMVKHTPPFYESVKSHYN